MELGKQNAKKPDQRWRSWLLWLILYAAAAVGFTSVYWWSCPPSIYRSSLKMLTHFTAYTPFQYRILVPAIARGIESLHHMSVNKLYFDLDIVWMFALFIAFAQYLRLFVDAHAAAPAALFILYPLVFNYVLLNHYNYPSDFASLVFTIWGLTLLFKSRLAWLYPVFVLATFNRETSCFLILALALLQWGKLPVGRLALHFLALCFLWLGIKLLLRWWFAGNPGEGTFENHFRENRLFLAAMLGRAHGFDHFSWANARHLILVFGGIWVLIPLGWKNTPALARRLLWIVPIYFAAMMPVGVVHEVRIYGELIPILAVPAFFGLGRCLTWVGIRSPFSGVGISRPTPVVLDNK
jgi:hypothetical protein